MKPATSKPNNPAVSAKHRHVAVEEWRQEGSLRFGEDVMRWRFVCPSCGHVAAVQDWKDAGANESAVAFSCVGRWAGTTKQIFESPGPCNYAGGGLFGLNPVRVTQEGGYATDVFEFADADSTAGEGQE